MSRLSAHSFPSRAFGRVPFCLDLRSTLPLSDGTRVRGGISRFWLVGLRVSWLPLVLRRRRLARRAFAPDVARVQVYHITFANGQQVKVSPTIRVHGWSFRRYHRPSQERRLWSPCLRCFRRADAARNAPYQLEEVSAFVSEPTVYLLHFSRAYHHARHYIGFSNQLAQRLELHQRGASQCKLTVAAAHVGIKFFVARVWEEGSRDQERWLKEQRRAADMCPICCRQKGRNVRRTKYDLVGK